MLEILKTIFLGIVEGVTEWLPISSTGHMLLVDRFLNLNVSEEFKSFFFVVIQLGAILAVITIYWNKLIPWGKSKSLQRKKDTWSMWGKVIVACIPSIIIGLPFDDYIDEHLHTPFVIALMLIIYGIAFIIVENMNKNRIAKTNTIRELSYKTALLIGVFQALSIIPGTSRSGATIIGGIILGTSRVVAAEFTFFLAIPTMFGASLLKLVKYVMKVGLHFTGLEAAVLIVGMVVAYVVSIFVIKFLMNYIKKHDFKFFGWYRIILGALVILYFALTTGLFNIA